MKRIFNSASLAVLSLFLSSCINSRQPVIVSPHAIINDLGWTKEELSRGITIRTIRVTPEASYHVIRLKGQERPHVHDQHDAVIFVLSGKAEMFLQNQTVLLESGDVLQIPHGVIHQAKNVAPTATEVYAVFTPPYDGRDMRVVKLPGKIQGA